MHVSERTRDEMGIGGNRTVPPADEMTKARLVAASPSKERLSRNLRFAD